MARWLPVVALLALALYLGMVWVERDRLQASTLERGGRQAEKLAGLIQERYGKTKEEALKKCLSLRSLQDPTSIDSYILVQIEDEDGSLKQCYAQIDSDRFATRIIGRPVYDSPAADANHLGDINDIVIDEGGRAVAVTIGVGGFLGIGEKQVAVAYSALSKEVAADNTERYILKTTVEELTAAPEFVVVEDSPAGGDAMAPTDTMTPAPVDASSAPAQ